jgi:uncharacterized membrane protein
LTGGLDAIYYASLAPATAGIVASACTLLAYPNCSSPAKLTPPVKTLDIQIPLTLLPTLSYYSTILTIITAVPSIITGAMELSPVIQRDGFSSKKAQTGVLHALINDITVFGAVYNWWSRRNENTFTPSTTNVALSTAIVPVSIFAAYLGGSLIYKYGMGVGIGSGSKQKKSQ